MVPLQANVKVEYTTIRDKSNNKVHIREIV